MRSIILLTHLAIDMVGQAPWGASERVSKYHSAESGLGLAKRGANPFIISKWAFTLSCTSSFHELRYPAVNVNVFGYIIIVNTAEKAAEIYGHV
jgi:hypothetical protein